MKTKASSRMMKYLLMLFANSIAFSALSAPEKGLIEAVKHLTRVKIIESNTVTLRPGSIYDNSTYFESIAGIKPKFNYEFLDSGLGAAEPLYPMYQKGHQ